MNDHDLLNLRDRDIVVFQEQLSQHYLFANEDASKVVTLESVNLAQFKHQIFFEVLSSGVENYWFLRTLSKKYLKINTTSGTYLDYLKTVTQDPQTVVDKSPYLFAFVKVPTDDDRSLFVVYTFYNGGLSLQQRRGLTNDIHMATRERQIGAKPELQFQNMKLPPSTMNKIPVIPDIQQLTANLSNQTQILTTKNVNDPSPTPSTTGLSAGPIVMITIFSCICVAILAFLIYIFVGIGQEKKKEQKLKEKELEK